LAVTGHVAMCGRLNLNLPPLAALQYPGRSVVSMNALFLLDCQCQHVLL